MVAKIASRVARRDVAWRGRPRARGVALAVLSALLVGACGGGSDDAPPPPPPALSFVAGDRTVFGRLDGTGTAARFNTPVRLAHDSAGNVYVVDHANHAIRKMTPAGEVTTYAGTLGTPGATDGFRTAATFNLPGGIAIDGANNMFIADWGNATLRKIAPDGTVSTVAGSVGLRGNVDGNAGAARFGFPADIALCGGGDLYVVDQAQVTVRRITPSFDVTTIAGTAGTVGSDDGNGTAARFNGPVGIACDATGNLYVADAGNVSIRKITPQRDVTTFAGLAGSPGNADGSGTAARFTWPFSVTFGPAGNLYVADSTAPTIRKITPAGNVTTVVGQFGQRGFTPGALPGLIDNTYAVTFVGSTLYFGVGYGIAKVTNMP